MNYGYSIETGRAIAAEQIAYEDTGPLQIVCPSCREPVIKCIRRQNGRVTHFLKHHRAARTADERARQLRCELRTSWLDAAEATAMGAGGIPKGQDMEAFLAVFANRARTAAGTVTQPDTLDMLLSRELPTSFHAMVQDWPRLRKALGMERRRDAAPLLRKHVNLMVEKEVVTPQEQDDLLRFLVDTHEHLETEAARPNLLLLQRLSAGVATIGHVLTRRAEDAGEDMGDIDDLEMLTTAFIAHASGAFGSKDAMRNQVLVARSIAELTHGRTKARSMPQAEALLQARSMACEMLFGPASVLICMVPYAGALADVGKADETEPGAPARPGWHPAPPDLGDLTVEHLKLISSAMGQYEARAGTDASEAAAMRKAADLELLRREGNGEDAG